MAQTKTTYTSQELTAKVRVRSLYVDVWLLLHGGSFVRQSGQMDDDSLHSPTLICYITCCPLGGTRKADWRGDNPGRVQKFKKRQDWMANGAETLFSFICSLF